jgi:hypothetical protein
MEMSLQALAAHTLQTILSDFHGIKKLGDGALAQLQDDAIGWAPAPESNSASVIVKHMSGNMISRWTDFLTSDGEKPGRSRDDEFVDDIVNRAQLLEIWEHGWNVLFQTLESLQPDDLLREVKIRDQSHTVLQAVHRQIAHYAYHTGQLVYVTKSHKTTDWKTLSIAKGESAKFNSSMNEKFGHP